MAHYQNAAATTSNSALIGGFTLYTGATVGVATTNLGLGRNINITENLTTYTSQADNGIDPAHGVSRHTATITFELLEFYIPNIDAVRGTGFDTDTNPSVGTYITGGSVQALSTGGFSELTARAYKFTNYKLVSAATVETAIVFYKAYLNAGMAMTFKSDNDDDPINVYPVTLEAICDSSRAAGDQLYKIETEIGA
jgi:hypothetical protein